MLFFILVGIALACCNFDPMFTLSVPPAAGQQISVVVPGFPCGVVWYGVVSCA